MYYNFGFDNRSNTASNAFTVLLSLSILNASALSCLSLVSFFHSEASKVLFWLFVMLLPKSGIFNILVNENYLNK